MKNTKVLFIITIIAFALTAAAPWILEIATSGIAKDEPRTGEIRELAEFPKSYSNDYLARIDSYVKDHSPMRTYIINLVNSAEERTAEWYSRRIMTPYVERMARINETPSAYGTPAPGQDTPEPTATPDWGGLFGDDHSSSPSDVPSETPEVTEGPSPDGPDASEITTESVGPSPTAHEHVYGEPVVVTAATCTNSGISRVRCTVCNESKTIVTEALGHDYSVVKKQTASFEHDGYTLIRCSRCGDVQVTDVALRTGVPGFYTDRKYITYSGSGYKGMHGWYFYSGSDSITYLQGDNVLSEKEMAEWNRSFTDLKEQCDVRGINLVILVCPNKEQVYQEYLPLGIDLSRSDDQKRASVMAEYMKANSKVKYVYPLREMKTAKILYETYLQQDTHWNAVGGFVAAMQVYKAIGMPTTGLQNVEVIEHDHTGGDLVGLGVGPSLTYKSYSVNYKPEITERVLKYYSNNVTGGNETPNDELKIYVSDSPNRHKAVIVGDSFRHSLGAFIAKDFAKVTQAHRGDLYTYSNYVKDGETGEISPSGELVLQNAIRELSSGDLLIIMAVERYDADNEKIAWEISRLMASY